jgi:hypothetical protein
MYIGCCCCCGCCCCDSRGGELGWDHGTSFWCSVPVLPRLSLHDSRGGSLLGLDAGSGRTLLPCLASPFPNPPPAPLFATRCAMAPQSLSVSALEGGVSLLDPAATALWPSSPSKAQPRVLCQVNHMNKAAPKNPAEGLWCVVYTYTVCV